MSILLHGIRKLAKVQPQYASLLDPLIRREERRIKTALRQQTFKKLLEHQGSFGIISAYASGKPKSENKERHGQLMAALQKLGYGGNKTQDIKGQWEGVSEKSLFVKSVKPSDIFQLGRFFGQDAVIYKSPEGVLGMYNFKKKTAEVAVDPNGLPSFDISQGKDLFSKDRNWSFSINFLWGKEIPWDGINPLTKKDIEAVIAG